MEYHVAIASVMVCVDFERSSEARISIAAGLAVRFNAVLIGVAGWTLRKSADSDAEFPPADESLQAKISAEFERLGEMFRRSAGAIARGIEWRSSPHFPNEVIAAQARAADLVVIGRDPLPGDVYRTYDPGAIILACGRPVLVLPSGVNRLHASRVLIAWKNTREARRAVRDALPFLKEAEKVTVAAVGPPDLNARLREQLDDVAQYLQRHGINVGAKITTSSREKDGHVLLHLAEEQRSDLIVAGAYGRSRLTEWIFGGVTRDLLTGSKIACLFAN